MYFWPACACQTQSAPARIAQASGWMFVSHDPCVLEQLVCLSFSGCWVPQGTPSVPGHVSSHSACAILCVSDSDSPKCLRATSVLQRQRHVFLGPVSVWQRHRTLCVSHSDTAPVPKTSAWVCLVVSLSHTPRHTVSHAPQDGTCPYIPMTQPHRPQITVTTTHPRPTRGVSPSRSPALQTPDRATQPHAPHPRVRVPRGDAAPRDPA